MEIEHLTFSNAPERVGPFSHAVKAGDFLFVTGQMPTQKNDKTKLVFGGIEIQTKQVMENLKNVLNEANSNFDKVIFARVYLVNFQDFDKMKKIVRFGFFHLGNIISCITRCTQKFGSS